MLRQSSSRNYRSKKLRPRHSFQAFLLFAVGIWIVYQLSRSYGKRRAVVLETGDSDAMDGGEAARRRLGRKGFLGFAGDASDDEMGSQRAGWGAASSDDPSSKTEEGGDGDGDEEDLTSDEDDGADGADDGLDGDLENDDDRDFLSQSSDIDDELKTALEESDRSTGFGNGEGDNGTRVHEPKELNSSASAVAWAKAAASVQDTNSTEGGNADGRTSATDLGDSTLKNASTVNQSLHDGGTAGEADKDLVVKGIAVRGAGAGNEKHNVSVEDNRMINHNETAVSAAGHDISS